MVASVGEVVELLLESVASLSGDPRPEVWLALSNEPKVAEPEAEPLVACSAAAKIEGAFPVVEDDALVEPVAAPKKFVVLPDDKDDGAKILLTG